MKRIVHTLFLLLTLNACATKEPAPWTSPSPLSSSSPVPSASPSSSSASCETVVTQERLTYGSQVITKTLPAYGKFVVESHIKSDQEHYSGKDGFPRNATEGIAQHLALHAALGINSKAYTDSWTRDWTPAEFGGTYGQGSIEQSPPIVDETWIVNMQWANKDKPAPGTRYLAQFGGKSVVVVAGWETGPEEKKWFGGMQPAPFYVLGATDEDNIKLGRMKDQSLPLGPIKCAF